MSSYRIFCAGLMFPAQTGQPLRWRPVRVSTRVRQTWPSGHCHHTRRLLPAVTVWGVSSPLSVGCHCAAMAGSTVAKSF